MSDTDYMMKKIFGGGGARTRKGDGSSEARYIALLVKCDKSDGYQLYFVNYSIDKNRDVLEDLMKMLTDRDIAEDLQVRTSRTTVTLQHAKNSKRINDELGNPHELVEILDTLTGGINREIARKDSDEAFEYVSNTVARRKFGKEL